jgi:ABC-2 type transport system permease protein
LIDRSGKLGEALNNTEFSVEILDNQTVDDMNKVIDENHLDGIVYIETSDAAATTVTYFSVKQPSVNLENEIKTAIRNALIDNSLKSFGVENVNEKIAEARRSVTMKTIKIGDEGKQTGPYHRTLCLALGLTIYMFVFLFSSQVMRGVLEEKSNKIIELIITSVSPVKFMAGKIIGIALLGLTQIVCWSIVMYGVGLFLESFVSISASGQTDSFLSNRIDPEEVNMLLTNINTIDFNTIIPAFTFFFVGGYLLYSSIFAAISAAVKHSDEMQQITTVISMPLILAILVLSNTVNSPDSSLSYWFSLIPFTSPVVMMGRVVYGVPWQDFLLSALLLVATVAVIIWLSGKIYKNAILYRGKKITLSEIISLVKD